MMNQLGNQDFRAAIRAGSFIPPSEIIPNEKLSGIPLHKKIFPPYGKKIDDIRKKGLVPAMRVIVSTRWELGKAYPRIVVTNEVPVCNLQFRYLAGLSVQIVHFNSDGFLDELIDAIRHCKPKQLCLFNMDNVATEQPALKIIEPRYAKVAIND